jgi:hypothetical protein
MLKPMVFIGSSSEGLEIAQAIEYQLQKDAEITIWNEGAFGLGWSTIEALLKAVEQFDFAIMILTPDDIVLSRDQSFSTPRDNVIFEIGLFMGALGRFRTFAVYDADANLKLLSDLAGITLARYNLNRSDKNVIAAVGPACTLIRNKVKEQGHRYKESKSNSPTALLDAITTEQLILEINNRKQAAFIVANEDIVKYSNLLERYNTGAAKLYPNNLLAPLGINGGGSYFNFSNKSNEYGYGSDICLINGSFRTGFAGADYGYLMLLGDIEPALLFSANETFPSWLPLEMKQRWAYLWSYRPPNDIKQIRVAQRETDGKSLEGGGLSKEAVALEGKSYILRSIQFDHSDLLIGFYVVRILRDGTAIIVWKILSAFQTPIILRRTEGD